MDGINLYLTEKDLENLMQLLLVDEDLDTQVEETIGKICRAYYVVKQQKKKDFIE